jgi:hypothetical protein
LKLFFSFYLHYVSDCFPSKAGQAYVSLPAMTLCGENWIPAFAGMTIFPLVGVVTNKKNCCWSQDQQLGEENIHLLCGLCGKTVIMRFFSHCVLSE